MRKARERERQGAEQDRRRENDKCGRPKELQTFCYTMVAAVEHVQTSFSVSGTTSLVPPTLLQREDAEDVW